MASVLPSGLMADQVIVSLLREGGPVDVGSSSPLPSNVSPRAVAAVLDSSDPALNHPSFPALLVGLQDPEAVQVLASRAEPVLYRWAVLLNPVSQKLSSRPVLPSLEEVSWNQRGRVLRLVAPAALPHFDVLAETDERLRAFYTGGPFAGSIMAAASPHWVWGQLPCLEGWFGYEEVSQWCDEWATLPESLWIRSQQDIRNVELDPSRSVRTRLRAMLARLDPEYAPVIGATLDRYVSDGVFPYVLYDPKDLGGCSFENPWLREVLMYPGQGWKALMGPKVKVVAGKVVGQELYKVTGDDLALWSVGCDLLQGWDRSLPEWLEAVGSLR